MDPSRPLSFVLFVMLAPAVITGLVLLAVRRSPDAVRVAAALALGLGFTFGQVASLGAWPPFPPAESRQALVFIALAATAAGCLRGARRVPALVSWLVLAAVAAGAPWLLLRNLVQRWSTIETLATLLIVGMATMGIAAGLDEWGERRRGWRLPLVCWIAATATSIAVALTGSVIYAQFAGTLAAVLGAAIVFGWVTREANFSRGATAVVAVLIASLCVACVYLSSLPRASALLLLYSPLAAVAVDRRRSKERSGNQTLWKSLAATVLVAAVALFIAYRSQASSDYGE